MDAVTQPWPTNRADALALGRAIFEPLAPAQKVERAARVLAVATEHVTAPAEVRALLDRVRDPSRWGECHDAFRALRTLTLAAERSPTRGAYYVLLLLAENVAKTAYNASGGAAPFDHDAPWWVADCARSLVEAVGDARCERRMWDALSGDASG